MLHNLWPEAREDVDHLHLDFIPDTRPAGGGHQAGHARCGWTSQNGSIYPVFDVLKGTGEDGRYTYPDDADEPYGDGPPNNRLTVDRPTARWSRPAATCTPAASRPTCGSSGPARRAARRHARRRARATPPTCSRRWRSTTSRPGAVSWDVSMSVTPGDYARRAEEGRRARDDGHLRHRARLVVRVDGDHGVVDRARRRPAATTRSPPPVDVKGVLTHGHLAENDNHGGAPNPKDYSTSPSCRRCRRPTVVPIENFVYARGDMSVADTRPDREGRRHDHVRQQHRRAARERHLAHDHRRARRRATGPPASPTRSPTATRCSTPGSSATTGRRRPVASPGPRPSDLAGRHLHLLLPDPPVHAGRVPGRRVADRRWPVGPGPSSSPPSWSCSPPAVRCGGSSSGTTRPRRRSSSRATARSSGGPATANGVVGGASRHGRGGLRRLPHRGAVRRRDHQEDRGRTHA